MTCRSSKWRLGLVAATLSTMIASLLVAANDQARAAPQSTTHCYAVSGPKDLRPASTTTLSTVQEGYNCLLGHYVKGKALDDRLLLRGAYSYVVSSLQHFHIPLPTIPPM